MLGRAWLIALVTLGAAFAGCLGGEDVPAGETDVAANDTPEDVLAANESKAAPDGRGEISAFKETNKTETGTGGMEHSHDYWQGRERVDLLSEDMWFIPLPLMPCRADGKCYPTGTSIADIDIPEPMLVYEGTEYIEVKFDNFRVSRPTGELVPNPAVVMAFDYLTAADDANEFRTGSEGMKPGETIQIPVGPLEADMPHQVKSLWLFRIYTKDMRSPDSAASVSVYFNFTVTAVRGREVVDWPPHPNLYADSPTRTILDGSFTTDAKGWADYWISGADANWIYPEKVISYGTDRIEVEITKQRFDGKGVPIEPDFFYLEYRNASYLSKLGNGDLSGGAIVDPGTDGTTYKFVIPVDDYGMDTPYGQSSRWAFRFMARYGDMDGSNCPELLGFEQGCQWFPYTLDYTMRIVAYGHSTAAGATDVAARGGGA